MEKKFKEFLGVFVVCLSIKCSGNVWNITMDILENHILMLVNTNSFG